MPAPRPACGANPGGPHAVAVGLDADFEVEIDGHVGYYCAGMNKLATVRVRGNCGVGVAENMMSGVGRSVDGNASQSAGATGARWTGGGPRRRLGALRDLDEGRRHRRPRFGRAHGRVHGPDAGALVVCGDAGEALGDSIYEARLYVRGTVAGLGADCIEKEMRDEHVAELRELLDRAGVDDVDPADFRRYGSARQLYNFDVDNAGAY